MNRTRLIRATATVGLLAITLAGCGGETTGTPVSSYRAPDPATATGTTVALGNAVAVSPSGSLLAVVQDGLVCVRLRVPEGARGSSASCPHGAGTSGKQSAAVFSPNSNRVVTFANALLYPYGTSALILDSTTTSPKTVTFAPSASAAPSAAPSASADPSSTTNGRSRTGPVILSYLWRDNETLIAVSVDGAVYRVDAGTGVGTLLARVGTAGQGAVFMAAIGGDTLAISMFGRSGKGGRIVTVSLTDGSVKDPSVDFDKDSGAPILLGVSPDGGRVLVSTADLGLLKSGATVICSVASGERTVVAGTDRTFAAAGAFSPDGSVIAIVATGPIPEGQKFPGAGGGYALQLARADGSTAPRSVADADPATVYGPMTWSANDWIVSSTPLAPKPGAWQIAP